MEKVVGAYRIYFFIATRASYLCLAVSTSNELLSTPIEVLFSIKVRRRHIVYVPIWNFRCRLVP